jgi:hypothetical protein
MPTNLRQRGLQAHHDHRGSALGAGPCLSGVRATLGEEKLVDQGQLHLALQLLDLSLVGV